MEKITKKIPAASKRTVMIALAIFMFIATIGTGMLVHVVLNKVYGENTQDAKLSSSIAGLTVDNFMIEHHIGNNISSFNYTAAAVPLPTIKNSTIIPNKVHVNTTAEIEKAMNDAVNYVNTHPNTNMSDPHYKPDSNSKRFKFGPDIEVPLNTYNYTLSNGTSY